MSESKTTKTPPSNREIANLSEALWQDAEREIERLKKALNHALRNMNSIQHSTMTDPTYEEALELLK